MQTFSIHRSSVDRLTRIGLACACDAGPIAHIGLRVTPTQVRFSATDGRILASLVVPIEDLVGTPGDVILERDQFTTALKAAGKAAGRITVRIDATEARISNGSVAAVARRITGTFPEVQHVWTRPAGRRWVPALSSLDPRLISVAQKIVGKGAVLFSAPTDPAIRLERLWSSPGRDDHAEAISLDALRAAVTAPAYWSDHELALLLMPISRSDAERQIDLSAHALPAPQVAGAAA